MATKTKINEKHTGITVIYTIFLALLIALFFGLGVAAFYPQPKAPNYPVALEKTLPENPESEESRKATEDYEKASTEYQKKSAEYNRNVSMITLGLAVFALAISLIFINRIMLLSDGLMLGGVFTLIYSIIRGFAVEDARYRFVIVSIGLCVTIVLGYIKFIKPIEKK